MVSVCEAESEEVVKAPARARGRPRQNANGACAICASQNQLYMALQRRVEGSCDMVEH